MDAIEILEFTDYIIRSEMSRNGNSDNGMVHNFLDVRYHVLMAIDTLMEIKAFKPDNSNHDNSSRDSSKPKMTGGNVVGYIDTL